LLYAGAVVEFCTWQSDLNVSQFKDAKFRLRERDLACEESSWFSAGSEGL
jgi:hypothetical protein